MNLLKNPISARFQTKKAYFTSLFSKIKTWKCSILFVQHLTQDFMRQHWCVIQCPFFAMSFFRDASVVWSWVAYKLILACLGCGSLTFGTCSLYSEWMRYFVKWKGLNWPQHLTFEKIVQSSFCTWEISFLMGRKECCNGGLQINFSYLVFF